MVKASFRVSTTMDTSSECYYMPPEAINAWDNPLSILMMSHTSPGAAEVNWYNFHPDAKGVYKVVVWHRGLGVLEETITVGATPETAKPPEIPGSPASSLLTGAAAAALICRRRR